jgi:peroxiredoxin
VISPDGKVAYYYQNLNPDKHVERMLNAVRALPRPSSRR